VSLILDDKIVGRIDQVNNLLILHAHASSVGASARVKHKYDAIAEWTGQITAVTQFIQRHLHQNTRFGWSCLVAVLIVQ